MKRNYVITIVDLVHGNYISFTAKEENIDKVVNENFGGWQNLNGSSSSNEKISANNFQQAGSTRDGKKLYSILAY